MGIRKDQCDRVSRRAELFRDRWPRDVPFGFCQCGCGHLTPMAAKHRADKGYCKGLPLPYLRGHSPRVPILRSCKPNPLLGTDGRLMYVIDEVSGCWNWTAAKATNGYGRVGWNKRLHQAHRASYEFLRGEVPPGADLDHLCRNRSCVNPDHLEPVSRAINARRGLRAKLSQSQVDQIRQRFSAGGITKIALGKEYGVHSSIISEIVNWRIWKSA